MRITAKLRTLDTPQMNKNGTAKKNQWGHDLYTKYVQCSDMKQIQLKEHMRQELFKIKKAIEDLGDDFFMAATGIDLHEKKQINDEPIKYTYMERLNMVYDRSLELTKQPTMGIIDMFNECIKKVYKGLGADITEIAERTIVIDDPDIAAARHAVFTKFFEYGKDLY